MGTLLAKRERYLFDTINAEVYSLAGAENTLIWKWKNYFGPVSSVSGSFDLMYGEPVSGSKHYEPYQINAVWERPTNTAEVTDEGLQTVREGRVFVSRLICEKAKLPLSQVDYHVQVGDIFDFFRSGRRFYLEVRNVEKDGWINDQDIWTQYLCEVVLNTTFTPDRKLIGSTNG